MFGVLGGYAYRRRWWFLGGWALVLAGGVALSGGLFDRLATVEGLSPAAESMVAERRIAELLPDGPVVYAVVRDVDVYDPAVVESVSAAATRIKQLPDVIEVKDLYTEPGGQIGADNRSTLVRVTLREGLPEDRLEALEDDVTAELRTISAPTVRIGGDHLGERAFGDQAVKDLAVGESVALTLLLVALLIIFGGIVAAAVPLVVAVTGISATLLVLAVLSLVTQVSDYALNIVTLLGIGLAVDYALLIVARYRDELATGAPPAQAVVVAMDRAGRAVAISGLAVAAALGGLAVFAEPLLASMALGGAVVVLVTTAIALTAVPALIAVWRARIPPAGSRTWVSDLVDRLRPWRRREKPLLARLAAFAQERPWPVATAATLGLLVLALPFLNANLASSDARALPASAEVRQAYEGYQELFAGGDAAPVTVVADVDPALPAARDYLNALNDLPQVARLSLRMDVPAQAMIVDLTPHGVTSGTQSRDLVRAVRGLPEPFPLRVTGEAAKVVDYQESVAERLPIAVLVVVLALFVLLFALTGSVLVPLKALILNALTFVATLGVLVAVFQWGLGEPLLFFDSWGGIDLTTPLLLFVFIFGLTVDYEVFLLARIAEEYERHGDNDRAVITGITRSGRVVTAAAVCITIVFLGFAVGGLVAVKEIGVGMAVAVILDVTVVRGLLLPAAMTLLADRNWWAPKPLRRLRRLTPATSAAGKRKVPGPRAPVGGSAAAREVDAQSPSDSPAAQGAGTQSRGR